MTLWTFFCMVHLRTNVEIQQHAVALYVGILHVSVVLPWLSHKLISHISQPISR